MSAPRLSLNHGWLWIGVGLLLAGVLLACLVVAGRSPAVGRNAVEIAVAERSADHLTMRLAISPDCRGPVLLMNWILEERGQKDWKRVAGKSFPGGQALDNDRGFSFDVTRPTGGAARRVRVQYGVGLYGAPLWRQRARLAWKTRRLAAALRYNEWEACESVAELSN